MKKFFFVIGLAAMCLTATAQNKSEWNVHAGLNVANVHFSSGSASAKADSHSQFQLGFTYSMPLMQSAPLYLGVGLDFTGRGTQAKLEDEKEKINLYYLQLPVTVSYHFNVADNWSIRPYAGLYFSAGLFSNAKVNGETMKDVGGDNFDFFAEYEVDGVKSKALKSGDFGLRFGADVAFKKHYSIGLGYDLGLQNINKDLLDNNVKIKNGAFYVRLGYNF